MKNSFKLISLLLSMILIVTAVTGTPAFAASDTRIIYSENAAQLKMMKVNQMLYCEAAASEPKLTLTVTSSNENVLSVVVRKEENNPGVYLFIVTAVGEGTSILQFTASDGTTDAILVDVEGVKEKNYTLSADTSSDFSMVQYGSYFIKLNYVNDAGGESHYPLITTDNPKAFRPILVSSDLPKGEFIYRIDALGEVGQTATIYAGSYQFIPERLCKVTIGSANKNIRLDTLPEYDFNKNDTYRFVAYTSSATAPTASVSNSLISVEYLRKVAGGYEYRIKALKEGYSLVKITQGGETATLPVLVNYYDKSPYVLSDTDHAVSLGKGESYTYKITAMGGGEPNFVPGTGGIVSTQLVKKDGIYYYYKVTAVSGEVGKETSLFVSFPQSGVSEYTAGVGSVRIKKPATVVMKSDTGYNFSLGRGASYTFKITGATSFSPGTPGIFQTALVGKSGNDSFYRITAVGNPGQATGFYMSAPGNAAQKVCVVSVGSAGSTPISMKCDTVNDFYLKKGTGYTFKVTGATSFSPGTPGVFQTQLVSRSGNTSYYRITAVGKPGQSAGLYMSVPGQTAQKACSVTISDTGFFCSDTTSDFTIPQFGSYTMKITAPGAKTVDFYAGTKGILWINKVKQVGNDYYYCIVPGGGSLSSVVGIYVSVDGQPAKRVCRVTVGFPKY